MGDVLNYFEIAAVILEKLQAKQPELSKEVLEAVCLAWQWGKKRLKPKKVTEKNIALPKKNTIMVWQSRKAPEYLMK